MTGVALPLGFSLEPLQRSHQRRRFDCGQSEVNDWLHTKALQHQDKRLSATRVLIDQDRAVAGFYTLATGQVDFGDLPSDLARKLPRRALPVAILAWLGVSVTFRARSWVICCWHSLFVIATKRARRLRSWQSSSTALTIGPRRFTIDGISHNCREILTACSSVRRP